MNLLLGGSRREASHRTMKMGRDIYQALKDMPLEGEGRGGQGQRRGAGEGTMRLQGQVGP